MQSASRRLSYYPFAISTILTITNIVIANFFNPIPFLFLGHLQPYTKKLKRKLKLQSTFKGNKMQVFSTASKTSVATTDAIFDCHDSSGNLDTMYGYHQRENTGSRLFTEVKPCWTGLLSGWVTI